MHLAWYEFTVRSSPIADDPESFSYTELNDSDCRKLSLEITWMIRHGIWTREYRVFIQRCVNQPALPNSY